nr:MAG TPA: chromatin structure-remodeling complex protein [Caudoviricetes sp.]
MYSPKSQRKNLSSVHFGDYFVRCLGFSSSFPHLK